MPFSYSNTVIFANPTVSFLKLSGGVEPSAQRQATPRNKAEMIVEMILRIMILPGRPLKAPPQPSPTGRRNEFAARSNRVQPRLPFFAVSVLSIFLRHGDRAPWLQYAFILVV